MQTGRLRLRLRTHDTHSRGVPLPVIDARRQLVADVVAFAFCDGEWTAAAMAARARHDLGLEHGSWLDDVASAVVAHTPECPDGRTGDLVGAIAAAIARPSRRNDMDPRLWSWIEGAAGDIGNRWPNVGRSASPIRMGESRWPVARLDTAADVARLIQVDRSLLDWFADVRSLERDVVDEDLRHYDYRWRSKRNGEARLVEAPKQNLKYVQRRILRQILDAVPPHDAAHGFRRGRSIQTYAGPHTGRAVVLRLDLRNFFSSVAPGRIFATFAALGYPDPVAHALTGLTTNAVPGWVFDDYPAGRVDPTVRAMLRGPHLPQGSPTSPALANLVAFGLDVRLNALARRFDASYTRYADDLAFSGDDEFDRGLKRFVALATTIVRDEGFAVAGHKTRIQRAHRRQVLTGLTVNRHVNVSRADYDHLRAVLHDAACNGPATANRLGHPQFRAHLEGRIGLVQATNPARARSLWRTFDRIDWS